MQPILTILRCFRMKSARKNQNRVARVPGADVATERKVRGTVRRTVGLRYTLYSANPPPHNTTPTVAMTRCTELPTTGIMVMTPHFPSYSIIDTIPSSRVRTLLCTCVLVCTCVYVGAHGCQPRVPQNNVEDLLLLWFPWRHGLLVISMIIPIKYYKRCISVFYINCFYHGLIFNILIFLY